MNHKTLVFSYLLLTSILVLGIELSYLYNKHERTIKKSALFVQLTQLPDLAFYSETFYTRHRTLSTIFDTFGDDGTLYEYSRSSFVVDGTNRE